MALLLLSLVLALFAQDSGGGPVPEALLRPRHGEPPRFPQDYGVGDLGRCDAPEEAYQAARSFTAGLLTGSSFRGTLSEEDWNKSRESISALAPRTFRIGGGRNEADGSVSFLVRFIGREQAITGELYLRRENAGQESGESNSWQAEDLLLEESAALTAGKYGPGISDLPIYERFF
jgi:hypothetical protein